jgi:rSAM/selenodomain-associated transferase 2
VIPALNAARLLGPTLDALAAGGWAPALDVVVVDGGSSDGTAELAAARGARAVRAPRGRGPQLAAGAAATPCDWLLFLHADSVPEPGWDEAVAAFLADPDSRGRAGYFALRLDDEAPQARRIERAVAWRCRALGLPYGDQGLVLHRSLYERVGGFDPIPLMEDVAIVRRIGRRRLVPLAGTVRTSAERYRRGGWTRRPLRNLLCLGLWFAGASPRLLSRLYG